MSGPQNFRVSGVGHYFLAPDAVVLLGKVELIDHFLLEERGVTRVINAHFTHHLAHDNLEVLVVDLHSLQAIYVLNLVNDVFLNGRRTLDGKDIAWCDDAI